MVTRELTKGITRDITRGIIQPFNYYIFTVKTDNAGTSLSDQFTVPTVSGGIYDETTTVDWGDGNIDTNMSTYNDARWTHTFAGGAGTYEVKIWGTFDGWKFANGGDKSKITNIRQWGIFVFSQGQEFYGCNNLTVTATDVPKINTSTLIWSFRECSAVVDIPSIGSWDVSGVAIFSAMFLSINSAANLSIGTWNTSSAVSMNSLMAGGVAGFDRDLGAWIMSSVNTLSSAFPNATISTVNYDSTLVGWAAQSLQSSVPFSAGSSKWGFGYGGQARYDIISTYAWTITDNGQSDSTLGIWLNAHNLLKSSANPSDGTSVATWSDLTDYANDGTATGAQQPVFKTNIANGEPALLFDGVDDRLDIAAASEINDLFSSGGSVFVVFNAATEGEAIGRIFSKYSDAGDTNGGVLYLNDNGVGQGDLVYQKAFSTTNGIWLVENAVTYGNVVIALMTYDASSASNDPVFYINSKTAATVSENAAPVGTVLSDSTKALTIGNSEGTNRTFDGYIFEIAMWKKILSSQEISDYFDYFAEKYGETLS